MENDFLARRLCNSDGTGLHVSCDYFGLIQPKGFVGEDIQYPQDTECCIETLTEAFGRNGSSEIFNADQVAKLSSKEVIGVLEANSIKISMDGLGRMQDSTFVERLWWTLKYHFVYLHIFDSVQRLHAGLKQWYEFYKFERSHQSRLTTEALMRSILDSMNRSREPHENGQKKVLQFWQVCTGGIWWIPLVHALSIYGNPKKGGTVPAITWRLIA